MAGVRDVWLGEYRILTNTRNSWLSEYRILTNAGGSWLSAAIASSTRIRKDGVIINYGVAFSIDSTRIREDGIIINYGTAFSIDSTGIGEDGIIINNYSTLLPIVPTVARIDLNDWRIIDNYGIWLTVVATDV